MNSVLLGVCASVAAYKAASLLGLLRRRGVSARVMMTPTAERLVGAATFRALSGHPVFVDEWDSPCAADGMDHIAAVRAADILLVAPASADFVAKAAAGVADNQLLAAFLAANCPRVVAPAMNQQMWRAAATQRNIRQLQADGAGVFGPEDGWQACGEIGPGRMLAPEDIVSRLLDSPLRGRRIVISAGATAEYVDAMRLISNRSSGRLGFCLAAAAAEQGANVLIIAGRTTAPPPPGIAIRRAEEGDAMRATVLEETATADWFFSVAAVADFRPAAPLEGKPERQGGEISLTLSPTEDILAETQKRHPHVRCVGFAAQSGDAAAQLSRAREKMSRKNIRWLALNDVADAGREDCQLTLLHADGEERLSRLPKAEAARRLLAAVLKVSRETSGSEDPAKGEKP